MPLFIRQITENCRKRRRPSQRTRAQSSIRLLSARRGALWKKHGNTRRTENGRLRSGTKVGPPIVRRKSLGARTSVLGLENFELERCCVSVDIWPLQYAYRRGPAMPTVEEQIPAVVVVMTIIAAVLGILWLGGSLV